MDIARRRTVTRCIFLLDCHQVLNLIPEYKRGYLGPQVCDSRRDYEFCHQLLWRFSLPVGPILSRAERLSLVIS